MMVSARVLSGDDMTFTLTLEEREDRARIELRRGRGCPRCGAKELVRVDRRDHSLDRVNGVKCRKCPYFRTPTSTATFEQAPYIPPGRPGSRDKRSDHGLPNDYWWEIRESDPCLVTLIKMVIYGIGFLIGLVVLVGGVFLFNYIMFY
jgi:hypothetical protein